MNKIIVGAICVLIAACGDGKNKKVESKSQPAADTTVVVRKADPLKIVPGELNTRIAISGDPSQTFAYYVPLKYVEGEKLPIILFFDPQGEGALPVQLYNELANEYHVVLAASNNCRNGLDLNVAKTFAATFISDASARLPVDKNNITLCGFSGGAKIAMEMIGLPGVQQLIYCGAVGGPENLPQIKYLGFAGVKDMNYTDLVYFDRHIPSNVPHYMLEWNGGHEFPSVSAFRDAFEFLKTSTVANYESKRPKITDADIEVEQGHKQKFIEAFQTKELAWWKTEVGKLRSGKKNIMNERLLGFISLACFSIVNSAIQQNDLLYAEKMLEIYRLADPKNQAVKLFAEELARRKITQ